MNELFSPGLLLWYLIHIYMVRIRCIVDQTLSKAENIAAQKLAYMGKVHTCIGPADLACSGVIGQSIGQSNAVLYQDSSVLSIH